MLHRRFAVLCASLALLASAIAPHAHAQSAPQEFKFGYGLKEDSNQGRAARFFAEQVAQRSQGRLKAVPVGAAALGNDNKMQEAVAAGQQEMMVGSTATLVSMVKEMALWDTPFMFGNTHEADFMLDGPIGTEVMGKLSSHGLIGLAYWENGFRNLTNSKRPVARMEDFAGLKLRVMQNDVFLNTFKILGADATPLSFAELPDALKSGRMDGQENPYTTILSSRFYETQKYLSITNHVYSPWIVLVSKKWWDALSAADRKALQDAAIAARDFERQDTRAEAAKALAQLKEKGMQINELDFTETTRMRNKMTRVYNAIGVKVGMDLWIRSQMALADYREKHRAQERAKAK